jgi:ferrochelatase
MTFLPGKHKSSTVTGLLIANTGSPAAPTPSAVRSYLKEFLSDQRVVRLPRWIWMPILYGIILNVRPKRSARLYAGIWTEEGSPLLRTVQALSEAISRALAAHFENPPKVAIGMRYGDPSIAAGLRRLRQQGAKRFLILPLFPQHSGPTSESIFEAVDAEFKRWGQLYPVDTIRHYHDHPAYIHALSNSIREHWSQHRKPERLLFSYHGIPLSYSRAGDPYGAQCSQTSTLLASSLGLDRITWQTAFQSRFGPQAWLQPYTEDVLRQWASEGVKRADVICPGFAADCLETLNEINLEMRAVFESLGGQEFHYIPALNDRPDHIRALVEIVNAYLEDQSTIEEHQVPSLDRRQAQPSQEVTQVMYRYE